VTPRVAARVVTLLLAVLAAAGCSDDDAVRASGLGAELLAAVDAVEAELGPGQRYFEVTATSQLTNVFVAVDDATAAVPYVFRDGELQPPGPTLTGASGFTFAAADVDLDPDAVLSGVAGELPESTIDALSVEGGEGGVVRYIATVRSEVGGVLEVTVGPDGAVLAVDPL
jgi:hypothetical protein